MQIGWLEKVWICKEQFREGLLLGVQVTYQTKMKSYWQLQLTQEPTNNSNIFKNAMKTI